MAGQARLNLSQWRAREWAMTALALAVILVGLTLAGQGLAGGILDEVLRVRMGGDTQTTRIVVDLERGARGAVVSDGGDGRVVVALQGVRSGRALAGRGVGLVRDWRVAGGLAASRVELELTAGAEVERRFLLPPSDGVDHYRYVIDLKGTGRPVAAPVRTERRAEPRAERPLVVIDAGHGGRDPGAAGAAARESAVTLAAATELKRALERSGRYRVRLTRESDVYVALDRRVAIARQADADLFISLHADAGADPATRGASVYTLSEQGVGRARREFTRADDWQRSLNLPGRDASVDRILLDMTQRTTQNRSAQLARTLIGELEQARHPLLRRSHRDAGLAVLLAPDVPAVLLEMGFITNPEDERLLTDARARRRMMRAVVEGIDRYFDGSVDPVQLASSSAEGRS